ncbi:MAG: hypothetical protein GXO91_10960 [FCB group bacterium]|nr:hypothetical protein [FCB group bacterium]
MSSHRPFVSPFTAEPNNNWLKKEDIKSGKNLRIFIAHGKDDEQVKFDLGHKSEKVLSSCDYNVTFIEFNGGHFVDDGILTNVKEWLKQ